MQLRVEGRHLPDARLARGVVGADRAHARLLVMVVGRARHGTRVQQALQPREVGEHEQGLVKPLNEAHLPNQACTRERGALRAIQREGGSAVYRGAQRRSTRGRLRGLCGGAHQVKRREQRA